MTPICISHCRSRRDSQRCGGHHSCGAPILLGSDAVGSGYDVPIHDGRLYPASILYWELAVTAMKSEWERDSAEFHLLVDYLLNTPEVLADILLFILNNPEMPPIPGLTQGREGGW